MNDMKSVIRSLTDKAERCRKNAGTARTAEMRKVYDDLGNVYERMAARYFRSANNPGLLQAKQS